MKETRRMIMTSDNRFYASAGIIIERFFDKNRKNYPGIEYNGKLIDPESLNRHLICIHKSRAGSPDTTYPYEECHATYIALTCLVSVDPYYLEALKQIANELYTDPDSFIQENVHGMINDAVRHTHICLATDKSLDPSECSMSWFIYNVIAHVSTSEVTISPFR